MFAFSTLLLLIFSTSPASPLLNRADSLFSQRHRDAAKGRVANTERALQIMESYRIALEHSPSSSQAWAGMLQSVFFASYFTDSTKTDWHGISKQGIILADSAVRLFPQNPEILTWAGWVWCRYAEIAGIVRVARTGAATRIRNIGQALASIAPEYAGGAGYRILALVHSRAPRIPVILPWPDTKSATVYFTRSVEVAPQNSLALYALGEHLVENGRQAEGITYLHLALQVPPDPKTPLEERFFRHRVQHLLQKLEKSAPNNDSTLPINEG